MEEPPRKKPLLEVSIVFEGLEKLPNDVVAEVCDYLDLQSLSRFSRTCSNVRTLVNEAVEGRYKVLAAELAPRLLLPRRNDYKYMWFRTRFLELRKKQRVKVSTGIGHTVVVRGHDVFSFGEGTFGSLGLGDLVTQESPKQVDVATCLKKHDPENIDRAIGVSCGTFHTALLTEQGRVLTNGEEEDLRLGYEADTKQLVPRVVPFSQKTRVLQVSLGANHGLLLTADRQVYSFGKSTAALGHGKEIRKTTPRHIVALKGISCISVAAGEQHSMVLSDSGELFTFGTGRHGRLGHGSTETVNLPRCVQYFVNMNTKICHVAAGGNFSLAIDDEGNIFSFGSGSAGKLGHNVAPPYENESKPKLIKFFTDSNLKVADCTAANTHSAVLTCGGNVYTFGLNRYGKLGLGDEVDRSTPSKVKVYKPKVTAEKKLDVHGKEIVELELVRFLSVSSGDWHTMMVSEDNLLYTVGGGWFGRLGHGNQLNTPVPKVVEALRW